MPELISNGLAWFFAWLFMVAGWQKLRNPAYYRELLAEWLPGMPRLALMIYMIASVEIVVALMLLIPVGYFFVDHDAGLISAAVLLVIYALFMSAQLAQGRRDIRCGCTGPAAAALISPILVIRNLLCVALALMALIPTTGFIENSATVNIVTNSTELASRSLSLAIAVFLMAVYLVSEKMIVNRQDLAVEQ